MKRRDRAERGVEWLFQQLQVAGSALGCSGCFLDILKKLSKVFFFGGIHARKSDSHPVGRCTPRNYPIQRQTLYPNLATRHPESNFDFGAPLNRCGGFYLAPAATCVGKIAPDRCVRVIDPQFDRYKTFDSRMPSAIVAPVSAEDIGFKRWRCCSCSGLR